MSFRTVQTSIAADRVLLAEKQIVLKESVRLEHAFLISGQILQFPDLAVYSAGVTPEHWNAVAHTSGRCEKSSWGDAHFLEQVRRESVNAQLCLFFWNIEIRPHQERYAPVHQSLITLYGTLPVGNSAIDMPVSASNSVFADPPNCSGVIP